MHHKQETLVLTRNAVPQKVSHRNVAQVLRERRAAREHLLLQLPGNGWGEEAIQRQRADVRRHHARHHAHAHLAVEARALGG